MVTLHKRPIRVYIWHGGDLPWILAMFELDGAAVEDAANALEESAKVRYWMQLREKRA